jgi:hypothetical protein
LTDQYSASDTGSTSLNKKLIALFWLIAIVLGAFQAWDSRYHMNADGISYLDIGDAYWHGNWKMLVNGHWSPLYPFLLGLFIHVLKPAPYYEFTVVHLVNFLIYLLALGCFHFLLKELIHYHRYHQNKNSGSFNVTVPDWAWIAIGYSLFIHSSLNLITIASVTPDMFVAAIVYLASGILLRIRRGLSHYPSFALLGAVLGFGYLTKAAMFPLGFIFLLLSLFSTGNIRRALPRAIVALIIFLFVASPLIIALSSMKGRYTFGDSGKYNYWFHVNNYRNLHWDGAPPDSGIPKHPPRKIFDMPEIYEFGTPIGGTYPLWYDPAYWHEGIKVHFNLKNQLRVIKKELIGYYEIFYQKYRLLIFGSLILYLMGRRKWMIVKDAIDQWHFFIPAIAALGMYSLVAVDYRYVGPFIALLWLGIFSGVRLPDTEDARRLLRNVTILMVLVMMLVTTRHIIKDSYPATHVQWQVADSLKHMGILPGDKVASIGHSYGHFWARLAKLRIVAEIPFEHVNNFWNAGSLVKSRVMEAFSSTGAKAVVTDMMPDCFSPAGWKRLGNTGYYAYMLSK